MTTYITRTLKDRRTLQEKQEAALVAAFRQLNPADRVRLIRRARLLRVKWSG